jgi:hypothetical protein
MVGRGVDEKCLVKRVARSKEDTAMARRGDKESSEEEKSEEKGR